MEKEILSDDQIKINIDTPDGEFNEANIFGLKDEDMDLIMSNFCLYFTNVEIKNMKSISETITKFVEIEKNVLDFLKNNDTLTYNQKKLLKMLTHEMIEQKFKDKENPFCNAITKINDDTYSSICHNINEEEYEHYFEFLLKDENNSIDLQNLDLYMDKIQSAFKKIFSIVNSLYISKLSEKFGNSEEFLVPNFLCKKNKKKLKNKINYEFKPFIKEHYHLYMENKIEVKVLKNLYHSYSIRAIDIFDLNSLKPELMDILFKIFILSNVDYLLRDEYAYNLFFQNFKKYCEIMNLKKVFKSENVNIDYFSNKLLIKIQNEQIELPKKEREDVLALYIQILRDLIKDSNQRYFFIIFSFSFMLNNIISIEEGKQVINGNLICNSRERQLLHNLLKVFDNYLNLSHNAFEINSYTQSLVINNILKASCPDMFDSEVQLKKYFTMEIIEDIIKSNCENKEILREFNDLVKGQTRQDSGVSQFFKSILRSAVHYNSNEIHVDLSSVNLKPYDQFSLSTNACLCVSGFTSDGIDQQKAWENFSLDMNKYIDLYYFNWPSQTYNSLIKDILLFMGNSVLHVVKEDYLSLILDTHRYAKTSNVFHKAKAIAKVCGKLLAHIIASKTMFSFQTINLVGFSLGSHLIKHCLKEIDRLAVHDSRLRNVIQNVVFVAGATHFKNTDKWVSRFKSLVAGRIINCHGENDYILKFLFKITTSQDAIGFKSIDFDYDLFENWDFTHLSVGHLEYRKHMDYILKTIKL